MNKFVIINDTHNGIRNSSEIFLDNADDFYFKVLFPYMEKHKIPRIIHFGDVFDNRKFINFKALNRYRKGFLSHLRKMGYHMDVIPGNHDTYFKNTNHLNSLKELLGYYMGEVTIWEEPTVIDIYGTNIALLPWICSENYEKSVKFISQCKADILFGHLELKDFEVLNLRC
mgnify:CR=1 FL=1